MLVSELETITRQAMDAEGSARWSSSEIRARLAATFEDEWANLLDAAPNYRMQTVSVTTDANGLFTLASLDTGADDALRRFYRVISINDGNYLLTETSFDEVPMAAFLNYSPVYPSIFYLFGDSYQVLPKGARTLSVTVNYRPQRLLNLSAPSVAFDWPEGAEYILAYEAASRLLNKGGAEADAARTLAIMAEEERARLLNELRRRSTRPTIMRPPDRVEEWGSR